MELTYVAKNCYEEKDIERINILVEAKEKTSTKSLIDLSYESDDLKEFKPPIKTFSYLIKKFRPEYIEFSPYPITIKKLNRGNNMWLKNTNLLGIDNENGLELHVDIKNKDNIKNISVLWLLLHEFRHHVQYNNPAIKSMTLNYTNYNYWRDKYMIDELGYHENTINHVFHELAPFEIDANLFACELLNIEYPGSGFHMRKETTEKLENNRRIPLKKLLQYNLKFFKDFFSPKKIKVT